MPKQFLALVGEGTLFQNTLARCQGLPMIRSPIIVCNEDHRFLVAQQLRELGIENASILLEPVARNTAPAIAAAAFAALQLDKDAVLLVMPSDHVVNDAVAFGRAVVDSLAIAQSGKLVTFGIVPTAPETGFGYIEKGGAVSQSSLYSVASFKEKPSYEQAKQLVSSGRFVWNSGVFLFSAKKLLEEVEAFEPLIYSSAKSAFEQAKRDLDFVRLDATSFALAPSISIDYAVMEKTVHAAVKPMECGWSDLGSWSSIWDVSAKDSDGNALSQDGIAIDCSNTYVSSKKLVATIGLTDIVVVDSDDALLIAHRSQVQKTKEIVDVLKTRGPLHWQTHRKVSRPWGTYDSIDASDRFQVKRITVNPGARLSLQMHHHRAEHWIVVSGTALITKGDEEFMLSENQSTYIPLGITHRLANPGKIPLELIEVQSGSYLGEDDIVRFEDVYGRQS
jgi:mannose-1-phosphate guanylyltransferase / mannose-6-phosphate isomerase